MTDPKTKPTVDQTAEETIAEVAIGDGDEQEVATSGCPIGEPKGGRKVATKKTTKKAPAKKAPVVGPEAMLRKAAEGAVLARKVAAKKAAATRAAGKAAKAAAPAKPKPTAAAKRAKRELPPEGTKVYARYKGKDYEAVIRGGAVKLGDDLYPTLSAAGKAVTGKPTCNGWVFWSTEKRAPRKPRGKK